MAVAMSLTHRHQDWPQFEADVEQDKSDCRKQFLAYVNTKWKHFGVTAGRTDPLVESKVLSSFLC